MKISEESKAVTNQTFSNKPYRSAKGLLWILVGVVTLLLLAKILFSLNIIAHIFNFPFQTDESEGMIVSEVHLMDGGTNLYALPDPPYFVSAPYPPLYYLLNWPFLHFGGVSFKPGRAISLAASLGIAILLYRIVILIQPGNLKANKFRNGEFGGAIAATTFWATLGLVAFWGDAVKPDMTAVFFSLGGIYAALIWFKRSYIPTIKQARHSEVEIGLPDFNNHSRTAKISTKTSFAQIISNLLKLEGWLYLAAFALALAVLTKQTAFAGPFVVFLFVLLQKPLAAFRFLILWLILGFGPMLLMNLLSDGGYWWHNVSVHQLPWTFENYWKFTFGFLQSYQIYFLIALVFALNFVVSAISNWKESLHDPKLAAFLYLAGAAMQGFSVGTYGGNHNHLLEMAAAICLCAGLAIVRLWQVWQNTGAKIWQKLSLPVVLVLLIVQGLGLFVGEGRITPSDFPVLSSFGPGKGALELLSAEFNNPDWLGLQYRVPPQNLIDRLGEVAAILDHYQGQIYSDNVSLVLAAHKPIFTTDPFTQTHATFYGRWNETELVSMINQQKFVAIAGSKIDNQCTLPPIYFSPGISSAVKLHYKLEYRDTECVFLPKK